MKDTVAQVSNGVVYGVSAGALLGVPLESWMMGGTILLLIMNLTYTAGRLWAQHKERKNGSNRTD